MTDEEMAEEYAHNHVHYEVAKRENGTEYAKEVSSVTIKEAYLAGLGAGRPQWHNLMKAPNDLPAKRQRILCYTSDPWCHNQYGVKKGKHCDVEMGTYMGCGEWYIGCYHTCVPPKAWCEIPKFE